MVIRRKKDVIHEDRVFIGKLMKPHGLKGEIKFHSFGCPMDILESITTYFRDSNEAEMEIESIRGMEGSVILKIKSIDNRDDAEKLNGEILWIHAKDLPELDDTFLYASDLLYANAETEEGILLGKVEDIIETGSADVLVIRGKGQEHLVPVHDNWIKNIDRAGNRVTVKLLDYDESAIN